MNSEIREVDSFSMRNILHALDDEIAKAAGYSYHKDLYKHIDPVNLYTCRAQMLSHLFRIVSDIFDEQMSKGLDA